ILGGKAVVNHVTVDPSVTVPTTIAGGQRSRSRLVGGGGDTREHGWLGHTTLVGGTGPNELIGRVGRARVKPSGPKNPIFRGVPRRRTALLHPRPPGGIFYEFVHGRLIPVVYNGLPNPSNTTVKLSSGGSGSHSQASDPSTFN